MRAGRVALATAMLAAVLAMSANGAAGQDTVPSGYWMVEADGTVYGFGDVDSFDLDLPAGVTVVDGVAVLGGTGLVLLRSDGVVATLGTAPFHGSADPSGFVAGETVSAVSARADGSGYWIFTNRGRVISRGAAGSFGDLYSTLGPGGVPVAELLNGPVVAAVATADEQGYWMLGSDGGVFSFGSATFHGSMGGRPLNAPVIGIVPDPDGVGYWLIGADGGIFAFDAPFRGSVPGVIPAGVALNAAVIGALAYGDGYLMVASDGGIFSFSDLDFLGSLGANPPDTPIVAVMVPAGEAPEPGQQSADGLDDLVAALPAGATEIGRGVDLFDSPHPVLDAGPQRFVTAAGPAAERWGTSYIVADFATEGAAQAAVDLFPFYNFPFFALMETPGRQLLSFGDGFENAFVGAGRIGTTVIVVEYSLFHEGDIVDDALTIIDVAWLLDDAIARLAGSSTAHEGPGTVCGRYPWSAFDDLYGVLDDRGNCADVNRIVGGWATDPNASPLSHEIDGFLCGFGNSPTGSCSNSATDTLYWAMFPSTDLVRLFGS